MDIFAEILKEIHSHYHFDNKIDATQKIENNLLNHLMDRCLRVASHLIPPDASQAAICRAKNHGLDIFKLREKDRNKVEENIKKSDINDKEKFILEHYVPVNQIIKEVKIQGGGLDACKKAIDSLRVVWVLKSEDDALNKNGHRKKRPDPMKAYQDAGIIVCINKYGSDWLK
jgi:hypothetical protein